MSTVQARICEMREIESDWRALVRQSRRATPFQSFDWIYSHAACGLSVLPAAVAFVESGACIGIAPMEDVTRGRGFKRLALAGGDYRDLISAPGRETDVAEAFLAWVKNRDCDLVDMRNLRADSVALVCARTKAGASVAVAPHQGYPAVPLPSVWDEYEALLSPSLRRQLRYHRNKLARDIGPARVVRAGKEHLDECLDVMFRLHQKRFEAKGEPGAFASTAVRQFHTQVAQGFCKEGWLRLYVLYAGAKEAAALYCFQKDGEVIYYLGGFDPEFAVYCPSKLLIAHAIKDAIESGARVFDFLKGEEDYKRAWRAESRQTYRLLISSGLRGRAVAATLKLQPRAKRVAARLKRKS